jgi:hypothetical protein
VAALLERAVSGDPDGNVGFLDHDEVGSSAPSSSTARPPITDGVVVRGARPESRDQSHTFCVAVR